MENKYYTPDISEFHVGFEFEIFVTRISGEFGPNRRESQEWEPFVHDLERPLQRIQELIAEKRIRVRHLCREDIEALGWSCAEHKPGGYSEPKPKTLSYRADKTTFEISNNHKDPEAPVCSFSLSFVDMDGELNMIDLSNRIEFGGQSRDYIKFSGYIKNKSELNRIMNMTHVFKLPNNE